MISMLKCRFELNFGNNTKTRFSSDWVFKAKENNAHTMLPLPKTPKKLGLVT